jgi:hypothetical protein
MSENQSTPIVGTWGYYFSPRGEESPKHKKPCQITRISGDMPEATTLTFKNPLYGWDALNRGYFQPDPLAEYA